jgi:hypothetical protein
MPRLRVAVFLLPSSAFSPPLSGLADSAQLERDRQSSAAEGILEPGHLKGARMQLAGTRRHRVSSYSLVASLPPQTSEQESDRRAKSGSQGDDSYQVDEAVDEWIVHGARTKTFRVPSRKCSISTALSDCAARACSGVAFHHGDFGVSTPWTSAHTKA